MQEDISLPLTFEAKDFKEDSLEHLVKYITTNYENIRKLMEKQPAILYRGFKINTLADFEYLISNLPIDTTSYVGGDSPRTKLSSKIYTSTEYPADQQIVLHNEMSFSNNYPRYLFFYCELPSIQGGETPLADNRELYRRLPNALLQKYQAKKLKYIMNLHSGYGIGKSWQDVFETDNKGKIEQLLTQRGVNYSWRSNDVLQVSEIVQPVIRHPKTNDWIFFSQAHQWHPSNLEHDIYLNLLSMMPETDFYHYVCYADDEPLDEDDLAITRQIIDDIKIVNPWQRGDVLLLDNMLAMHGRNSYQGDRKIRLSLAN